MASVLLLLACRPQQQQAAIDSVPLQPALAAIPPAAIVDSTTELDDSTLFRLVRDSIALLERRLDSLGNHPSAAPILFRLGQFKAQVTYWPYADAGGEDFAGARPEDYIYDRPNGLYIYNGNDWKKLMRLFPDDSLADDVAWRFAQMFVQRGDCEGDAPCQLHRDVKPFVDFLMQFPRSTYDSEAVARANEGLMQILSWVRDLRVDQDSGASSYTPAPVESLLVRYDSVALWLKPPLRATVRAVTGPLWVRFGKPARH